MDSINFSTFMLYASVFHRKCIVAIQYRQTMVSECAECSIFVCLSVCLWCVSAVKGVITKSIFYFQSIVHLGGRRFRLVFSLYALFSEHILAFCRCSRTLFWFPDWRLWMVKVFRNYSGLPQLVWGKTILKSEFLHRTLVMNENLRSGILFWSYSMSDVLQSLYGSKQIIAISTCSGKVRHYWVICSFLSNKQPRSGKISYLDYGSRSIYDFRVFLSPWSHAKFNFGNVYIDIFLKVSLFSINECARCMRLKAVNVSKCQAKNVLSRSELEVIVNGNKLLCHNYNKLAMSNIYRVSIK